MERETDEKTVRSASLFEGGGGRRRIDVYLSDDEKEELKQACREEGLTLSGLCRQLLREWMWKSL